MRKSYSKLGKAYDKDFIDKNDKEFHKQLNNFRIKYKNNICADCDVKPTQWASVNLGIFICTDCAQIHRGIGTHITKVKSCMGSYNWHPDELDNMFMKGNEKMNKLYENGFSMIKPTKDSSLEYKKQYILNKYSRNL